MNNILNTLPIRMKQIGIPYYLSVYSVYNRKTYRESVSIEDFFILIFSTLLFIDYKDTRYESCSLEDIKEFLTVILEEYNIELDINTLYIDIINYCLQNDGKINEFNSNFLNNPIVIKIIDVKTDDKIGAVYKLSTQAREWLYSSYEMIELGNISIDTILLKKAIKSGNFLNAKNRAEKLLTSIKKEIEKIEVIKRDVLTNINSLSTDDLYDNLSNAYELMQEQIQDIEDINNIINNIFNENYKNINVTEEDVSSSIKDIHETKTIINIIIGQQQILISKTLELRNCYKEELFDYIYIDDKNYINIGKNILNPIKNNPGRNLPLEEMVLSLLDINCEKIFNPNNILNKQTLYKEQNDESIEQEEFNEELLEDIINEEIINSNCTCRELFLIIIQKLISNKKIKLSELLKIHPELKEHLKELKVVLVTLESRGKIDFVPNSYHIKVDNDHYTFAPEYISCFYSELNDTLYNKKMLTNFLNDKIIIEGKEKNNCQELLKINDMIFELSEEEE